MQYQVPQFIEREMRLIGPVTVRQTLVLSVGAIILFVLYFLLNKFFFIAAVIIIGAISMIFAFGKINERNISKLLFSYTEFFLKPRIYLWGTEDKDTASTETTTELNKKSLPEQEEESTPTIQDIKNLAEYLDKE